LGVFNSLIGLLADTLGFLYKYIGDYGVAIIILTVAIRVIILPLTIKQTQSMLEMQKLQPKLKELQEKYKDNKEKLQQEMMKFYSEHKVNPLGGCLPLLLQLPIFYALFTMLNNNKAIVSATFLGMFQLGQRPSVAFTDGIVSFIPYLILLVLMAITTYIPQKMITQDAQQQKMSLYMVPLMVFIAWNLQAGVLVYWITTNVWSIGQQYVMLKFAKTSEVG
jgi:YidC/Oxa1 family membrane protein insertase